MQISPVLQQIWLSSRRVGLTLQKSDGKCSGVMDTYESSDSTSMARGPIRFRAEENTSEIIAISFISVCRKGLDSLTLRFTYKARPCFTLYSSVKGVTVLGRWCAVGSTVVLIDSNPDTQSLWSGAEEPISPVYFQLTSSRWSCGSLGMCFLIQDQQWTCWSVGEMMKKLETREPEDVNHNKLILRTGLI